MPLVLKVVAALLAAVLGVSVCDVAAVAAPARTAPTGVISSNVPDWWGSAHAMPSRYRWLDDVTPADTYTIVVVRGLSRRAVLRAMGGVKRTLPDQTPDQALDYVFDHMGPSPDYRIPRVAQVQRRGHAVVVYAPYGILEDSALAGLSRGRVAAEFFTDVDADTYVTVAQRGRVVRQFDAMFKPPKQGALPAEQGLDWGARHENTWATAWAFDERLTLTHLSRSWFEGAHPTVVLHPGALL
jgi:hypothetical protein